MNNEMRAKRARRQNWPGNRKPSYWTPEELAELKAAAERFLTTGEQERGWNFEKLANSQKDILATARIN